MPSSKRGKHGWLSSCATFSLHPPQSSTQHKTATPACLGGKVVSGQDTEQLSDTRGSLPEWEFHNHFLMF